MSTCWLGCKVGVRRVTVSQLQPQPSQPELYTKQVSPTFSLYLAPCENVIRTNMNLILIADQFEFVSVLLMTNLILQIGELLYFQFGASKKESYIEGVQMWHLSKALFYKKTLKVRPTIAKLIPNNQGTILPREASLTQHRFFRDLDRVRFVNECCFEIKIVFVFW